MFKRFWALVLKKKEDRMRREAVGDEAVVAGRERKAPAARSASSTSEWAERTDLGIWEQAAPGGATWPGRRGHEGHERRWRESCWLCGFRLFQGAGISVGARPGGGHPSIPLSPRPRVPSGWRTAAGSP